MNNQDSTKDIYFKNLRDSSVSSNNYDTTSIASSQIEQNKNIIILHDNIIINNTKEIHSSNSK